jgi:ADP-heptose:LPS heptosyltransferase
MKKILIVRCGALGDLVYATSVIDALLLEYGNETLIDFVCTPSSGSLFKADHRINKIFPLKHKKVPILLSKEKKNIIKASKETPYDILINFEYGKQFQSLLHAVQAKKKIGATYEKIELSQNINRAEEIKNYLRSIISPEVLKNSFPKIITEDFTPLKEKFHLSSNYIVLSPSNSHIYRSGINYRAWENEKWKDLIRQLTKSVQIVIVGAKNEEKFFQNFMPYPENVIDLVGKNSVIELATILENAKATVCTDSAVGHISAAVNTPVFVLMGPNNPTTDAPYQTPYNAVYPISLGLECSPCYKTQTMKNCTDNICMKQITVSMVLNELRSHLQLPL